MSDDILSRILIMLDADSSRFTEEMKRSSDVADDNTSKIQKSFDKVKIGAAGIAAGVTAAMGILDTALFATAVNIGKNVIEMDSMAKVAGITTQELIALKMAGAGVGIELDRVGDVATDFNEKIFEAVNGNAEAAAAFDALGVKITDSNGDMRQAMDVMRDVADSFAKMEDGATKSTLATLLGGDAFREFIPVLNGGADALDDAREKAEALGFSLSNEQIATISEFEGEWGNAKTSVEGFATQVVAELSPALKDVSYLIRETTSSAETLRDTVDILDTAVRGASAGYVIFKGAIGDTSKYITENGTLIDGLKGRVLAFADASIRAKLLISGVPKPDPAHEIKLTAKPDFAGLVASVDAAVDESKKAYSKEVAERFAAAQNADAIAKAQADAAKKAKAEADAAAKQKQAAADAITKSYDSAAGGLQRQIDLLGKTTELDKFRYELESGNLAKLAPERQANIIRLAEELDLKKATVQFDTAKKNLEQDALRLQLKYDISRQIYDIDQKAAETYKALSKLQRDELVDLEVKNRLTSEYQSLVSGLLTAEESRAQQVTDQLSTLNYALNAGAIDAEMYASQLQRVFDSGSTLPDFSTGNMDQASVESAQLELENRYAIEAQLRQDALNEKFLTEEAYQESVLNLELDYSMRKIVLDDQLQKAHEETRKANQQKAIAFFENGLAAMSSSSEKYSKLGKAMQKIQALNQIRIDTPPAAMAAYKAVVGIPFVGPSLAPIASAAAYAFGALQAKAVLSDSGSTTAPSTSIPSTASTSVTPIAEQPKTDVLQQPSTTVQIPADTLFTGRQMVDLLNEQLADGKKLNIGSINFIGID